VVGILFPPSIIGTMLVGGAAGGVVGHLWHGLSRGDMKELGDTLDIGEAALVVVGRSKLEETLDRELKRANKRIEKQVDADAKAFEKELDAAAKG
jgi:uncharacterized membrane protein